MIIHMPPTFSRQVVDHLQGNSYQFAVFPNREKSRSSLDTRVQLTGSTLLDFEWHSPDDQDRDWLTEQFGARDTLRARSAERARWLEGLYDLAGSPLLVPSGRPDQIADSLRFAREAVDVLPTDAEVWATVTVTRPGLTDPQVVMQLNQLHRGVSGIYLVVYDNAGFPSAWSEQELLAYLRIVGSHAMAGRMTIAAHAHVRGLMATALGAAHIGTGVTKAMKQYAALRTGGGAQRGQPPPPTASYLSLPLLAVLHGDRAEALLGADINHVESHSRSLADCQLDDLPWVGEAWGAWRQPAGNANSTRGLLSLQAISAAERELQTSAAPADLMARWLDDAARIAGNIPPEAFQTAGLRNEVIGRPRVFEQAREFLGV